VASLDETEPSAGKQPAQTARASERSSPGPPAFLDCAFDRGEALPDWSCRSRTDAAGRGDRAELLRQQTGAGLHQRGLTPGVTMQLGGDDQIGFAAHQRGGERVPEGAVAADRLVAPVGARRRIAVDLSAGPPGKMLRTLQAYVQHIRSASVPVTTGTGPQGERSFVSLLATSATVVEGCSRLASRLAQVRVDEVVRVAPLSKSSYAVITGRHHSLSS